MDGVKIASYSPRQISRNLKIEREIERGRGKSRKGNRAIFPTGEEITINRAKEAQNIKMMLPLTKELTKTSSSNTGKDSPNEGINMLNETKPREKSLRCHDDVTKYHSQ